VTLTPEGHDDNCPACCYAADPRPTLSPADLKYCVVCRQRLGFLSRHRIDGSIYCASCAAELDAIREDDLDG